MQGEGIALATDRASMLEEHLAAWRNKRPRIFWVGLALAFLVHALFIVGISSARQRDLGTPDGATDAIAVEIVDGATLKDSMEQPTPVTAPPGTQERTAALPAQQPPPPPPPPEPQAEPQPPAEAAQPSPPAEVAEPAPAPAETKAPPKEAPKPPTAEALPAMEDAPAGETTPQPAAEAAKPKQQAAKKPVAKPQAKQQPKPRTQTSALDLAVPYDGNAEDEESGGSSAVQRPPGITRSGENDEFARNVIRALQKTMPRENARGRVTVRIVLNENGSRADVKLLKSGGNADLDFNVMFAARGTAYPFPPKNATLVDRTFTVTYIYR